MIDNYLQYKDLLFNYENRFVNIWNSGLSAPGVIGRLTKLYTLDGKPKTAEDFYKAYIQDRGIEPLENAAKTLNTRTGVDLGICRAWVYKKACVEANRGSFMEWKMKELIESKGYECVLPTYEEDTTFGVDAKVYKDNNLILTIQLKPLSFFLSDKDILVQKRKELLNKFQTNPFGTRNCVMIYNNNDWYMNGGSYLWDLTGIVENTGKTKIKNANNK